MGVFSAREGPPEDGEAARPHPDAVRPIQRQGEKPRSSTGKL